MCIAPRASRILSILSTTALGVAVAACSAFDRKDIAESPSEAGSVKVSVVSVAPWEDIYTKLRPNFKLTGDGALAKVLPQTASFNQRQLDAFAAGLSVGSTDASADASALVAAGEEEGDGDGETPLPVIPDALSPNGTLAKEPIIEYKAAATLFQEVQLLNEYLEHAVIPKGYRPYLVRLQLAVLPHKRDQPFDIFTDFHFLPDYSYGEDFPKVVPLVVTDSLESSRENELAQIARSLSLMASGTSGGTPFATEIQRLTNRLEERQTIDLNSLFTVSQVTDNAVRLRLGARYDGGNRYEMTARTHNITLLVNLPRRTVDPKYDSIRTGDISEQTMTLIATSSMRDSRTGKTLEEGTASGKQFNKKIKRLARSYKLKDKSDDDSWNDGRFCVGEKGGDGERVALNSTEEVMKKLLYRYVFYDRYKDYAYSVFCMDEGISLQDEQALWSELSSLAASIPRDHIKIKLPGSGDPDYAANPIQHVFLTADETNLSKTAQCCVDDTNLGNCYRKDGIRFVNGVMTDDEKATNVRLPIAKNLGASRFLLSLQLGDHEFAAEKVTVDSNNLLSAKFPSLKSFRKFHPGGPKPAKAVLKASVKPNPWDLESSPTNYCKTAYIDVHLVGTKPEKAPPIVKINHAAETIAVQGGMATLTLVIDMQQAGTKADVAIKIEKATVKTHPAGSSVNSQGQVVVTAPGRFKIELENVDPSRNLEISVGKIDPKTKVLKDGNPASISIPTRSAAPQG